MLFAFGWANLSMLGWLVAAAAPILIHLWNRRQHREVTWAAMDFLLAAVKRQTHRLLFEQWLLVGIRTLLIVLLVVAVAEPYIAQPSLAVGQQQHTHHLLVLDGSLSMACTSGGTTRFDRAKEMARRIVADSPQGDAFSLVLMSSPPHIIVGGPTWQRSEIEREIDNLRLVHTPADLPATVAALGRIIDAARTARPRLDQTHVHFFSDLQRVTWAPRLSSGAHAEFLRQTKAINENATVSVANVGQTATENLAITALTSREPLLLVGQSARFVAELKNFGPVAVSRQTVSLIVDGHRAEQRAIDIAARATASVQFSCRFDAPGQHAMEVRAEGDALEPDNHRFLAVNVRQSIRTLCIDGRPSAIPFQGAADYLAVALSPRDTTTSRNLVQFEIASQAALTNRDLRRYDCVLLCNVAQFTTDEARLFERYLKDGRSLVFFLGDQVIAERYNRVLGGAGQGRAVPRILPATLGPVVDAHDSQLDPLDYRHPILRPFRGRGEAALLTTPIFKYFKLTTIHDSHAQPVLAMSDGDALIVESPLHRGRVVLIATAAEPRSGWNALALYPSFLPLVQEIVTWCVSEHVGFANVIVGEPLRVPLSTSFATSTIHMQTPDGRRRTVTARAASDGASCEYSDTLQSGVYRARTEDNGHQLFGVNVDTLESDLTAFSPDELQSSVRPEMRIELGESPSESDVGRAATSQQHGTPLHTGLLGAVLGLLLVETYLAQKMGR